MTPEQFPAPAESPEPSRPSLDPSEEEALFQHLRRYKAQNGHRRQQWRTLLAVGTVVAGAGLLVVVASVARGPRSSPAPEVASPRPVLSTAGAEPQAPSPASPTPARPARAPADGQGSPLGTPAPPPAPRPEAESARDKTPPRSETIASSPPAPAAPRRPASSGPTVSYQPRERLATVSPGDTKDRVFDRFATTFEQRTGSVVRVEGMRWRASGRSPHHTQVEVAEVVLADAGAGILHWFVFGDGRLLAWGRPEEWPAAARRHELEIDYRPAAARPGRR